MAIAAANDLREMTDEEIVDHIRTTRRDLFGLRFQHATGELENTAGLRNSKRALARAITIAHQRGIDINEID
jgi:large subunit ribosomal protein L29